MTVLDRLAVALGRNDEQPNVALAEVLAAGPDDAGIAELVAALETGSTAVRHDAIKVLYEIGARQPALIAGYAETFLGLLASRSNRIVWGALQALDSIAALRAADLVPRLGEIVAAADRGSVIAKDRAMSILARLAEAGFAETAVPLLLARLEESAPNQFPMYAELVAPVAAGAYRQTLQSILQRRLAGIEQPAKRARVAKVLRLLAR